MARAISSPWIFPAVKAALEGGGPEQQQLTGFSLSRPKIVQVSRGSESNGYIIVSDKETEIPVFITMHAREAFKQANPSRTLPGLKTCLVKLDRWIVSYTPIAHDSSGPKLAHDLTNDRNPELDIPICLQCSELSFVGAEGCSTFGDPKPLNKIQEMSARLKSFPSSQAMLDQLAKGQGLRALPDARGEDVLPPPISDEDQMHIEELEEMDRQDQGKKVERIAGVGEVAIQNGTSQAPAEGGLGGAAAAAAMAEEEEEEEEDGGSDFAASPAKYLDTQQGQSQEEMEEEEGERDDERMPMDEGKRGAEKEGPSAAPSGAAAAAAGVPAGAAAVNGARVTPPRPRGATTQQATTPVVEQAKAAGSLSHSKEQGRGLGAAATTTIVAVVSAVTTTTAATENGDHTETEDEEEEGEEGRKKYPLRQREPTDYSPSGKKPPRKAAEAMEAKRPKERQSGEMDREEEEEEVEAARRRKRVKESAQPALGKGGGGASISSRATAGGSKRTKRGEFETQPYTQEDYGTQIATQAEDMVFEDDDRYATEPEEKEEEGEEKKGKDGQQPRQEGGEEEEEEEEDRSQQQSTRHAQKENRRVVSQISPPRRKANGGDNTSVSSPSASSLSHCKSKPSTTGAGAATAAAASAHRHHPPQQQPSPHRIKSPESWKLVRGDVFLQQQQQARQRQLQRQQQQREERQQSNAADNDFRRRMAPSFSSRVSSPARPPASSTAAAAAGTRGGGDASPSMMAQGGGGGGSSARSNRPVAPPRPVLQGRESIWSLMGFIGNGSSNRHR